MTQYYDPNQQYNQQYVTGPKMSGMALTSMILGIAAVPLTCVFFVGIIPGIIAIILGTLALRTINRNPEQFSGKGLAITGMIVGSVGTLLVAALLAVVLLLPGGGIFGRSREMANRSTCAANVRGIMQSMVVYSADSNDCYPYLSSVPIRKRADGTEVLGSPAVAPTTPGNSGLMYSVFAIVGNGSVAPKQFICKSDPASVNPSVSPTASTTYPGYSPTYWTNPSGNPNLTYSYSFAFQYSAPDQLGAWWRNTMDAGVPIAADMNPGSQHAKGSSASIYNSLNHQGEGQNIAFGDAHAEFLRTPAAGEANGTSPDNIYNLRSGSPTTPGTVGTAISFPAPANNTQGMFDTWLVPAITNTSSYDRQ